jgi:hypothetical protein
MSDDERSKWTKVVADFEAADLSQREFAKERGVPLSNLRYWLYKLRKESRPLVTAPAAQAGGVAEHAAPKYPSGEPRRSGSTPPG